jgi:formate hydrogenlyase subunit 5
VSAVNESVRSSRASDQRWLPLALPELPVVAETLTAEGARLVSLFVAHAPSRSLVAVLALRGELISLRAQLPERGGSYQALSRFTPAALVPERVLYEQEAVVPAGHPKLAPILRPDADAFARQVRGEGSFVIPYGPIRSGIFETIQYVIDTGGEDVLAVDVRPFFKHRSLELRFEGLTAREGAALAERISGPSAVAHALAYSEAVERATRVSPTEEVQRWRVVHAELERIASHLDVATRLAEDAALAVGIARFGILKEDVMRLRARLTGSRFARGAVAPGGHGSAPLLDAGALLEAIGRFEREFERDRRLLLETGSFTDRLIGSGKLDRETIDAYGGVGPVARACTAAVDARFERPTGAYRRLGLRIASASAGDAMARLAVRFEEVGSSLHLIRQALRPRRRSRSAGAPVVSAAEPDGAAYGWAEAPMGELVYWVELVDGKLSRVRIASPSLRNWPLLAASFRGDVLTDFSFIEHSFGSSPAGADR